jgi:5-methylcytosine-specific restriction protein A
VSRNRIRPDAGFVDRRKIKKGPTGKNCCRQCGRECANNRRTFCGKKCVHEWKLRSSPTYVRSQLRKRDKGVCASCHLNTRELKKAFELLDHLTWRYGPGPEIPEVKPILDELRRALKAKGRTSFWDADHIKAVVEGGGECGLDNYQTLCIWCHRQKSAQKARGPRNAQA